MPKVNQFDQKRLIYYATLREQEALLEFVKSRGLYIIPPNFKDKKFSEDDLLSGKLDFCKLSPIPLSEIQRYPVNKTMHKNFWHTIDFKYPIIEWLWTRQPSGYCLDGRITWHAVTESFPAYLPEKHRDRTISLEREYMQYNSEMKGHADAIGRWLRKNYDNLEKGSSFWYSPETAAGHKSGKLNCCTFVPGSVDLTTVFIDDTGKKTHEVTTRDWKIFDFLNPRRKKK